MSKWMGRGCQPDDMSSRGIRTGHVPVRLGMMPTSTEYTSIALLVLVGVCGVPSPAARKDCWIWLALDPEIAVKITLIRANWVGMAGRCRLVSGGLSSAAQCVPVSSSQNSSSFSCDSNSSMKHYPHQSIISSRVS